MTGKLELAQVDQLLRLVMEVQGIPCERPGREARLVSGLARMLDAASTSAVFDGQFASRTYWRRCGVTLVGWDDHTLRSLEMLKHASSVFDPVIRAMARIAPTEPGGVVTATWHELVNDRHHLGASFLEPPIVSDGAGLAHALFSTVQLGGQPHVHGLGLYREPQAQAFSEEDRNLVRAFHAACQGLLLRPPPLRYGDDQSPVRAALSRRERQTLELVLSGLADKEIAERLGISRHTVNQYTKALYRRYAVTSRAQLLAHLLGQPQSTHSLITGN